MKNQNYYLGLDIGTDSVGYAVTDECYSLLRKGGKNMWGVTLFDEAQLNTDRRSFRTARRRLDRRQHRVKLVQELFAKEIIKIDPRFFIRLKESALWREDTQEHYTLFDDAEFTDREYHVKYPTIHHLIDELMKSDEPHDVRLVYVACAWLVAHRGHFLSDISRENVSSITDFSVVYEEMAEYLRVNAEMEALPWEKEVVPEQTSALIESVLKEKLSVTNKYKKLCKTLFKNGKVPKDNTAFPINAEVLLKALCGSKIAAADLFMTDSYADVPSFTLASEDEVLNDIMGKIGDDAELIVKMKAVYDWSVLVGVLNGCSTISEAKIKQYEQHQADLKNLKAFVRKYVPEKYDEIFREIRDDNYVAYSYHVPEKAKEAPKKKAKKDVFCDYLKKIVSKVTPDEEDKAFYDDMMERLAMYAFLPKQKEGDNRVIPYQLYWHEINTLLNKAQRYLPFLNEKDESKLTISEKLLSVFTFRVPYYVGPLNNASPRAWVVKRKPGVITPWNFADIVDEDASEDAFINRMLNFCTYLPGETVVPKESLLYHRYTVLNEINNIKINGEPITVELKQRIYQELFLKRRKVTRSALVDFLKCNGVFSKDADVLSGIDEKINSDLKPYHDFASLMSRQVLTEEQVEHIIERITYTEDKQRLKKWLQKEYPFIDGKDIDYITRLNYKDFGRLSARFLTAFEGTDRRTGEITTIMAELWNTNHNLMELLSDEYTFAQSVKQAQEDYYKEHPVSLQERLDEMRLSNAVKRPVLRALTITSEVVKATGHAPEKIFVEVTRGATAQQKNKRTKTRREQILELYKKCDQEDVRLLSQQIEEMGDTADNRLRSDALFLYYLQLGHCAYTWKPIDVSKLKSNEYNIDHIYPQSKVKDDSIIDNKVLVYSESNGQKSDVYPIDSAVQQKMRPYWDMLKHAGLMSDEKYKRLTRVTPFSEQELLKFINRQLTQTSQSVKAVAELLQEKYPDTKIVYTKARLTSDFRQEFELLKSRTYNDLHHAKDAYLNIVTGNVYDMRFSRQWFRVDKEYSVRTKVIFTRPLVCNGKTIWDGEPMLAKVKKTVALDDAHMTRYAYCRHGGLFDQMPLKASEGLISRKAGMDTAKYGGYNKAGVSFFVLVRYTIGKKTDVMVMGVELLHSKEFLSGNDAAIAYAKKRIGQILNKQVDTAELLLGGRILKINTMLSLDGFRVCLAGVSSGSKTLAVSSFMPFHAGKEVQHYIKKLEKLVENIKNNPQYVYNENFDKVTKEDNMNLYDLYINKLDDSVLAKRINNPVATLKKGRQLFSGLDVKEQARTLINIHMVFGRTYGGCDFSSIGGAAKTAATISFSNNISNWKKYYKTITIIDSSASGLWENYSENLAQLL